MSKLRLYSKVAKLFLQKKLVSSMDIESAYDRVCENYDNYFLEVMHQYNDKMLRNLYRKIYNCESLKVLDLAAGTGHNSFYLLKLLQDSETSYLKMDEKYSFTLVDISNGMLQKANEKLGDRVQYVKSDMIGYLNKCDKESFDLIICSWAIKYQDPTKIIDYCYRVLKPGGIIAVIVNTKKTLPQVRDIYQLLLEKNTSLIDKLMVELPNPKSLAEFDFWFESRKFKKQTSKEGSHEFKFKSSDELTEFVTSTGALAGFDRMLDLTNKNIQTEMTSLFKQKDYKTATHHFVFGIFQK